MPIKKKHLWQNRRFTILVARNFALIAGAFAVLLGLALLLSRGVTLRNIRSQQGDMDRANLRRQIQKDLEDEIATRLIDSYLTPVSQMKATADGEQIQLLSL